MQYTAGPPGLSCVQYTAGPSGLSCVQYTAGPPGLGPAVYCRPRAVCFTGGGVYGAAPVSQWVSAPFLPWVRVLVLCPASSPPCTRVLLRPFPGLRIPASLLCRLLSELPREWGIGLPGPTGSADPAPALGPRAARLRPSAEKLGCTGWGKRARPYRKRAQRPAGADRWDWSVRGLLPFWSTGLENMLRAVISFPETPRRKTRRETGSRRNPSASS